MDTTSPTPGTAPTTQPAGAAPDASQPHKPAIRVLAERLQNRPPQPALNVMYNESIRDLARCDQDYCQDPDTKWSMTGLYYVLAHYPESWGVVTGFMNDEPALQLYMGTQFKDNDIEKKIVADLNAHRFATWKNPLYNYDARKHTSPLWYRGAADLWRRNNFQRQGRPGALQCLDFAAPYHKLRQQYEDDPDNHKLERKFAYATWDQYSCLPGLQCPSLQSFALWCGHNPAASPDQIKQCLQIIPRFAQCSKPGFNDTVVKREDVFATVDKDGNALSEAELKRKHKKKVRAALRLRDWVVKAEIVTNQRRLMLDPLLKDKLRGINGQSIVGPLSVPREERIRNFDHDYDLRTAQLRKDIADETGDDLMGVPEGTEAEFVFAGKSAVAAGNKEKVSTTYKSLKSPSSQASPVENQRFGLESGELNEEDDDESNSYSARDTNLRINRGSKFGRKPFASQDRNLDDHELPTMISKYGRLPVPTRDTYVQNNQNDDHGLDEDFPELFEPIPMRSRPSAVRGRPAPYDDDDHYSPNVDQYDSYPDYQQAPSPVGQVGRVNRDQAQAIPRLNHLPEVVDESSPDFGSSQQLLRSILDQDDNSPQGKKNSSRK